MRGDSPPETIPSEGGDSKKHPSSRAWIPNANHVVILPLGRMPTSRHPCVSSIDPRGCILHGNEQRSPVRFHVLDRYRCARLRRRSGCPCTKLVLVPSARSERPGEPFPVDFEEGNIDAIRASSFRHGSNVEVSRLRRKEAFGISLRARVHRTCSPRELLRTSWTREVGRDPRLRVNSPDFCFFWETSVGFHPEWSVSNWQRRILTTDDCLWFWT